MSTHDSLPRQLALSAIFAGVAFPFHAFVDWALSAGFTLQDQAKWLGPAHMLTLSLLLASVALGFPVCAKWKPSLFWLIPCAAWLLLVALALVFPIPT
jgi:hypothetical protein